MFTDLGSLKGIKKFAVLGGTFDPIHNGHISVAREVLNKTDVEKVLFIPTGLPPHKDLYGVTDSYIRLEMTRLGVYDEKEMVVSSIEIDRKGMTYTVDTISQLRNELGEDVEFKFITGADAMHYISSWKDYKRLLKICSFIAVTRPGYKKNDLINDINKMEHSVDCNIEFIEIKPVDISSSMVREYVKVGKNISGLVPEKVAEYIEINGLYK